MQAHGDYLDKRFPFEHQQSQKIGSKKQTHQLSQL